MPYDTSWSIELRKTPDQNSLADTDRTNDIDAMAAVCLRAHEAVKEHGTPEMQATMRILLFQIAQEIAREQAESQKKRNGG